MTLRRLSRWAPAAAIVLVAVVVGLVQLVGDDDRPEAMAVESSAALFDSLDDLVAASDFVLVATITDIADGRTITSSDNPAAGIHSRLVELDVNEVLHGDAADRVVVEEADAFADGTPVAVDGMTELHNGDAAVWFLVAGESDAMPYSAAVNGQGRIRIVGDSLDASGDDPLSQEVASWSPQELTAAVRNVSRT